MGRAEARMTLQRGPELRQGPRSLSLVINVGCLGQCITCSEAPPFSQGQFLRKALSAINQEATLLEAGKMSACVLEGGSGCITASVLGSDHLPKVLQIASDKGWDLSPMILTRDSSLLKLIPNSLICRDSVKCWNYSKHPLLWLNICVPSKSIC